MFAACFRRTLLRSALICCSLVGLNADDTQTAGTAAASRPELVWHTGHNRRVTDLALAPDGKLFASSSEDGTVKIWDARTAHELRTFRAHPNGAFAVAFTPDGKYLASGGNPSVALWDIVSGTRVRSLPAGSGLISSLSFTRDGRFLAAGSWDKTAYVFETATGRLVAALKGSPDNVESVGFNSDGKILAGGSANAVVLWKIQSSQLISQIPCRGTVRRVAFSPDDRLLAYAVNPGGNMMADPYSTVELWDLVGRTHKHSFPGIVDDGFLGFSLDGKKLAYGLGPLQIVDPLTGQRIASVDSVARSETVALSQDWTISVMGAFEGGIHVVNFSTGEAHDSDPSVESVRDARISPDGRWLISAGLRKQIDVWELATGRLMRSQPVADIVDGLAFTPDGRSFISASSYGKGNIDFWNVESLEREGTIPGDGFRQLRFSPDGKRLACIPGVTTASIQVFDVTTRKLEGIIRTGYYEPVDSFAWSPNGKFIATGGKGSIRIFDAQSFQRLRILPLSRPYNVSSIVFSPDGKKLAGGVASRTVKVWNAETGAELLSMTSKTGSVDECLFDPDGTRLFTGGANSAKIWDTSNGNLLHTLSGHSASVNTLELTRDKKTLVTTSDDGTMRLWDAYSGEPLAIFVALSQGVGWVAYTPDGLFDGSADSFAEFGWRIKNASYTTPLDAFFTDFFYPGLLSDYLAGARPKAQVDIATALQVPGLHAMLDSKAAHIETREANLVVCFDTPPTALLPSLVIGGPLVAGETGDITVAPDDATCKFSKVLGAKDDPDAARLLARKPESITTPWDGKNSEIAGAVLHIFCVGIDSYSGSSGLEPLKYAAGSARAIHDYFAQASQPKGRGYSQIRIWDPLYDNDASLKAIRSRLKEMASAIRPGDCLLIFLSGHGFVPPSEEMFYFIPADAKGTSLDELRQSAMSTAVLADALREIAASRLILILDTCQSGGAIEALQKIAQVKARAAVREIGAKLEGQPGVGIYLLAAATPLEFAALPAKLKKSTLSEAILETLSSGGSEGISAKQLVARVEQLLPVLSERDAGFTQNAMASSVGVDFLLSK